MFLRRRRIYLDYASAPPVLPEAARAVLRASAFTGNPGAIHREGVLAARSLNDSRAVIAAGFATKAREIIFTSGLTESNNSALLGLARKFERDGRDLQRTHWIVSSIEHASVLECFAEIERLGGVVTHVDPDEQGLIQPEAIARALRLETVCVSVGWANNEIGIVQRLADIRGVLAAHESAHKTEVMFHSDAGQAPLYRGSFAHSLGVDMLALGSNKLYGPHGIGALYVGKRVQLAPVIHGGRQERNLRAGTENVALAAGFAAAFEKIARERESEAARLKEMRDAFLRDLHTRIPNLAVNGNLKHALPHMLNISIPGINSEYVMLALDAEGIAISTKSACREGEESRSHVVEALGGDEWRARNTLRFSLGRETSVRDVQKVAEILANIVHRTVG